MPIHLTSALLAAVVAEETAVLQEKNLRTPSQPTDWQDSEGKLFATPGGRGVGGGGGGRRGGWSLWTNT